MFDRGLKNKYKTKNTTSLKGRRNVVPPSFVYNKDKFADTLDWLYRGHRFMFT